MRTCPAHGLGRRPCALVTGGKRAIRRSVSDPRHQRARHSGNLLEVVVLITAEGMQIAIHAMPMRDKYAKLLEL